MPNFTVSELVMMHPQAAQLQPGVQTESETANSAGQLLVAEISVMWQAINFTHMLEKWVIGQTCPPDASSMQQTMRWSGTFTRPVLARVALHLCVWN